ncbi:MAG: recombinase family protein [Dehalococcoidia bacterium]
MTRAAAYFRVSSEAQSRDDRNSFEVQRAAFARACAERGYDPVADYTDVMSGRRADRPEYQRMLAAARSRAFDVILVTWLDRFGRDDREITLRFLELEAAGVRVEAVEEDVSEFIHLALGAWKAGQESQRLGDRVTFGNLAAARRGVALGRTPYGYVKRWDYTPEGRKTDIRFEVDEARAYWVRWAFHAYAVENRGLKFIARRLSLEAPPKPNGRPWNDAEARQMLTRRRYTGVWTWRVKATARREEQVVELPGAIPAIVSPDLFEQVQQRLAVKATLYGGKTQTSRWLLSGLARCAHCGGPMNGNQVRDPRTKEPRYAYNCVNHRKALAQCAYLNWIPADAVEEAVVRFIEEELADVDRIAGAIEERTNDDRRALLANRAALDEVDRKFARNMRLFDSGAIASEEQLATANRLLAEEQRRLNADRQRLLAAVDGAARRQREVASLPDRLPRLLDPATPTPERKAIIQSVIDRIDLRRGSPPVVHLRTLS